MSFELKRIRAFILVSSADRTLNDLEEILGKGDHCWSLNDEKNIQGQPTLRRKNSLWSLVEHSDDASEIIDNVDVLLSRASTMKKQFILVSEKYNLYPKLKIERLKSSRDSDGFGFYLNQEQTKFLYEIGAVLDIDF